MMRSLWAGVSGLQAHQIAMDVEGNNIANVNTTGFKYSRVNFANLLSQTAKIATAPQGELGGKNPMQIGLGTQVTSVTTIHKQGSVQTTDKNTDLAIQGDGFFVVSPDGGKTYKYTRNGDFTFDAVGNFTDSNGYIIQGWLKDEDTGDIDSTAPIRNIQIPPGLTTPANETSFIALKANLASGNTVESKSPIYTLDSYSGWYDKDDDGIRATSEIHKENDTVDAFNSDFELVERGLDMGVLFDDDGDSLLLREDQGVWISYTDAVTKLTLPNLPLANTLDIELNGEDINKALVGADAESIANEIATEINRYESKTGIRASVDGGQQVVLTNKNNDGTEAKTKNITLIRGNTDNTGFETTKVITAYQYTYSPNAVTSNPDYTDTTARKFNTTEDLRNAMQTDARNYVNYTGVRVDDTATLKEVVNVTFQALAAGDSVTVGGLTYTAAAGGATANQVAAAFASLANGAITGPNTLNGTYSNVLTNYTTSAAAGAVVTFTSTLSGDVTLTPVVVGTSTVPTTAVVQQGGTTLDALTWVDDAQEVNVNDGVTVTINKSGQFQIQNPSDDAFDEELLTGVNDIALYRDCCDYSSVLFPAGTVFDEGITISPPLGSNLIISLDGAAVTISGGTTYTIPSGGRTLTNEAIFPEGTVFGHEDDLPEIFTATFGDAAAATPGETIIFDGTTYTAPVLGDTDINNAAGFVSLYNANANSQWTAVDNLDGTVTFTSKTVGDIEPDIAVGDFTGTITNATAVAAPTQEGVAGTGNINVGIDGIRFDLNDTDDDHDMTLLVTQLTNQTNEISANQGLATAFSAIGGVLRSGDAIRTSGSLYAASHASSIDVYDSLGSKHTVRVEFTKVSADIEGSTWSMLISVAEPGKINYTGSGPDNIVTGTISFNSDGSLAGAPNPSTITFTPNNGATANQNILFEFGTPTQFDGMTSFDAESNTSGISQDGYPGGDLAGIRVDETGTLIGSFTNGRSFGLGQVAMAKFSNNEGLESDGGNTYIQTSNSGDPVIGQAAIGGRGFIQASALEMSNVDLSRSLTQLIVIQRGYQANSKTITTSDQMLNTLLQLKQ
jgi:flagellar hook protein FlgE